MIAIDIAGLFKSLLMVSLVVRHRMLALAQPHAIHINGHKTCAEVRRVRIQQHLRLRIPVEPQRCHVQNHSPDAFPERMEIEGPIPKSGAVRVGLGRDVQPLALWPKSQVPPITRRSFGALCTNGRVRENNANVLHRPTICT